MGPQGAPWDPILDPKIGKMQLFVNFSKLRRTTTGGLGPQGAPWDPLLGAALKGMLHWLFPQRYSPLFPLREASSVVPWDLALQCDQQLHGV